MTIDISIRTKNRMTNTMCTDGRIFDALNLLLLYLAFRQIWYCSNCRWVCLYLPWENWCAKTMQRKKLKQNEMKETTLSAIHSSWDFFFLYILFAAYLMSFFKMARFDCIHKYGAAHSNEKKTLEKFKINSIVMMKLQNFFINNTFE